MGQCHGLIRLPNAREIYFHRADLQESTAFNDLQIGDAVTFERSSWEIVRARLNVPQDARGSSIDYTRASCFSELFGVPGPSPHQSFAVRVHVPVESFPLPPVHDVPVEPVSMPIARTAGPAFEERWAVWRARVVALVIVGGVGRVTLGLRVLRHSW
jgi:hypothetical protein